MLKIIFIAGDVPVEEDAAVLGVDERIERMLEKAMLSC